MAALVSILPIVLLFVLMLGFKMAGHRSAFISLLTTAAIAVFLAPTMNFAPDGFTQSGVAWAFVEGTLKAVFPILIIILMALFSYNVLVESKQIDVIKTQFTSFSDDDGVTVLMLVWGFGGLLEGMAGFGTAVAIPAAILISLGYKPLFSALVSLIANTVPTGFGAVGVPVITLANEIAPGGAASQELISQLSVYAVMQLSLLYLVLPFIILTLTNRSKGAILKKSTACSVGRCRVVRHAIPRGTLSGSRNTGHYRLVGSYRGHIIYAKTVCAEEKRRKTKRHTPPAKQLRAWAVYAFILLFILLSGPLFPPINAFLKSTLVSRIALPIHAPGTAFSFAWIGNAGLMLFLGTVLGGLVQGVSAGKLFRILGQTLVKMKASGITVISLVAMSAIMSHSSMIAVIAKGLVDATGTFYPLVAPLVGAIGTFATGSDTSSNILFGKLQASVADQLGMNKSWLAAANTAGATGGKIISPQSIAIATAACEQQGQEGAFLRSAMPYAIVYVIIAGITVYCFTTLAL